MYCIYAVLARLDHMILQAVVFDLGETLIFHTKGSDELVKIGHKAMTDYLIGEGLAVELDHVTEVSNSIYQAYSSFAEKSFVEIDARAIYSAILYHLGIADYADERLIAGTISGFYGAIVESYRIFEDSVDVLSRLRERGLKLGLISNNWSADLHQKLLRKYDLERFFNAIVVSCKLGIRKPHKGIFQHCLATLGIRNEASIFVGDDPIHDVQGAKNAGMKCIWIKRKDYEDVSMKPDWTVESLSQAESVIKSLLS